MRCCFIFLVAALSLCGADRWQVQYFYDEDRSALTIVDLKFSSPQRGIAVGYITEKQSNKPTSLVSIDGGAHWSSVPLKETPVSLFVLNDSIAWMVTTKGIWQTDESGRSWRKLKSLAGVRRVYFQDAQHGWAVAERKRIYETTDGGKEWEEVGAAAEPKSNPEHTVYGWIDFADKNNGIIAGWSRPPRHSSQGPETLPDWAEPETALERREWPTLSILLETRDAGKTWSPSTASVFGLISRVRLSPEGFGLGLVQFVNTFEWPSEVFLVNWKTGKSKRTFRQKDRAVTDVAIVPKGPAYLAAVEPSGKLHQTPIPGKLKVLTSSNFADWKEMEVDYRATARAATIAVADEKNVWIATDTGMILKLAISP
jgi:hypothetical protein